MKSYDVIVCGGGPSGLAAALTAARSGAHTLLLEKSPLLGGMGTQASVHTFCGLYQPAPLTVSTPQFANPGFASETAESLIRAGIASDPVRMGNHFVLLHSPSALAQWWQDQTASTPQLTVSLESTLLEGYLQSDQTHAESLLVQSSLFPKPTEITAPYWIDATGNAALAVLWKQPMRTENVPTRQRSAWISGYRGFGENFELSDTRKLQWSALLIQGIQDKSLPREVLGTHFRQSPHLDAQIWMTLDLNHAESTSQDLDEEQQAYQLKGEAITQEIFHFLKTHHPDWKHALRSVSSRNVGTRESHSWEGKDLLTGLQLQKGFHAEEPVAHVSWPIELRESGARTFSPRWIELPSDPMPTIPAGCLRARHLHNVAMCGRILSADHQALAAVRVMGIALATGEAAARLVLKA